MILLKHRRMSVLTVRVNDYDVKRVILSDQERTTKQKKNVLVTWRSFDLLKVIGSTMAIGRI